jgi:D-alanyl-D-alanine-carboxypeptidase/D-alanyl-D-alanine-endopeptidase
MQAARVRKAGSVSSLSSGMRRRLGFILLGSNLLGLNLLGLNLLGASAAGQSVSSNRSAAPAQPLPPIEEAQSLGQNFYLQSGSTALVLIVVRGNQTLLTTFGESYPGSHQLPAANSLLRLCSLTKIFTTDLLVKLMQANVVRLDTPLASLGPQPARGAGAPRAQAQRASKRPITLGDLATHTAGLPRELGSGPRGTAHFTYPTPGMRWAWLATHRLRFTPGSAALYSNIGFDLLSDALAQAARVPYPQLLAARTLQPLGMFDTTFTPSELQCARLLQGAYPQGACAETTNTDGSSGLYSTPADMARFLQYLLGAGRPPSAGQPLPRQSPAAQAVYLNPASLTSISGLSHAGDPTGIGLGWIQIAGSSNADGSSNTIVEKTGGGAGFTTYIAMLPAQHTGLFFAVTDGPGQAHFNLFGRANNILLTLAGLPAMALPQSPAAAKHRARRPGH